MASKGMGFTWLVGGCLLLGDTNSNEFIPLFEMIAVGTNGGRVVVVCSIIVVVGVVVVVGWLVGSVFRLQEGKIFGKFLGDTKGGSNGTLHDSRGFLIRFGAGKQQCTVPFRRCEFRNGFRVRIDPHRVRIVRYVRFEGPSLDHTVVIGEQVLFRHR